MNSKRILGVLGLNIGIVILNIVLFSPGLVGISFNGESTFKTALAITVLIMSVVVFILGNYRILTKEDGSASILSLKTYDDYVDALKSNYNKRLFSKDITSLLNQIERLDKKKDTINDILLQKFNNTEISYIKFKRAISDMENLFYINIKSVINKLNIFDQKEYEQIVKKAKHSRISSNIINEKMAMYEQYIEFVKHSIEDNEEILLKLDKVLLELSKFNSLEEGELEDMIAMKEIDELIKKINMYR